MSYKRSCSSYSASNSARLEAARRPGRGALTKSSNQLVPASADDPLSFRPERAARARILDASNQNFDTRLRSAREKAASVQDLKF